MFSMRFDMRCPEWGAASATELYQAAVEMARWGDDHGCVAIQISEHHHSSDGYLPSPLVLGAAVAASTQRLPIQIAALLLPLHDPVRAAEDMVVLDHIAGGRVSFVLAIGYRPEEYAMFGRAYKGRGRRMEECVEVLRQAFRGEPFEYEGRTVWVRPKPSTPGGPPLLMGGRSEIVVKRAARLGMGVMTEGGTGLEALYQRECAAHGQSPGAFLDVPAGSVSSAFVAEDPDAAWAEYGPYLLHDAQMYGEWMGTGHAAVTRSGATTVEALREEAGNYRIFSVDEAVAHLRAHGLLAVQPLCGGLPPELAWRSLRLIVERVIPAASQ